MPNHPVATKLSHLAPRTVQYARFVSLSYAFDGLSRLRARDFFQRSGLFAALPLTGSVLEVEGDRGHLAEAAVHHIPNRRCVIVDSQCRTRQLVDRRVRRRKFHRVCAPPHDLPFGSATFEAAWIAFALARLGPQTQELVLAEMHRVVRPGGMLIAFERMPDTVGRRWHAGMIKLPFPSGARHHRCAEGWRAVLVRNGWHLQTEMCLDGLFRHSTCRAFVCRRL